VQPGRAAPSDEATWQGTVQARAFLGESVDHVIKVGSLEVRARCNPTLSLPPGTDVALTFPDTACTLIRTDE
jgi:iron(III) transport system ATP-binding protein